MTKLRGLGPDFCLLGPPYAQHSLFSAFELVSYNHPESGFLFDWFGLFVYGGSCFVLSDEKTDSEKCSCKVRCRGGFEPHFHDSKTELLGGGATGDGDSLSQQLPVHCRVVSGGPALYQPDAATTIFCPHL